MHQLRKITIIIIVHVHNAHVHVHANNKCACTCIICMNDVNSVQLHDVLCDHVQITCDVHVVSYMYMYNNEIL